MGRDSKAPWYRCIGMVQTRPLPGSYLYGGQAFGEIITQAVAETKILADCGFDSVILQNMGDMPVHQKAPPQSVACLSVVAKAIRDAVPGMGLGILVNWDGAASLAVACASGADFVRVEHVYTGVEVTSAGLLTAQCCEVLALRKSLMTDIPVYADVYESHGVALGAKSVGDAAWESVREAFADGLFLSGKTPGESIDMARAARSRVPEVPLFLGGGANADNVAGLLDHFDGICVGTSIRDGSLHNPVNPDAARAFARLVMG